MRKSSRRQQVVFAASLAFLFAFPGQGRQQPLAIQQVKGNVYLVKGGSGANTGFYIGDREVLVIDAKMTADSTRQEITEIKKLTDKPVTRIILTHSDGDHVNGLNGFPAGLKIYAHPRTKADLEEAAKTPNTGYLLDYLPNEVCSPCAASKTSVMAIKAGGTDVLLYHFGPAHTSGDLVVYFPNEKVAFVGDLAFVGRDPLIHRQKGGSSAGCVATLKALLSLGADTFIAGHNDPLSLRDIETLAGAVEAKREKVRALVAAGRSREDILKEFGIQPPAPPSGRPGFPSLVEVIYLELTEKK